MRPLGPLSNCSACGTSTPAPDLLLSERGEVCPACFDRIENRPRALTGAAATGAGALALGYLFALRIDVSNASHVIGIDFVGIAGGLVAAVCGVRTILTGLRHQPASRPALGTGAALLLLGLLLTAASFTYA